MISTFALCFTCLLKCDQVSNKSQKSFCLLVNGYLERTNEWYAKSIHLLCTGCDIKTVTKQRQVSEFYLGLSFPEIKFNTHLVGCWPSLRLNTLSFTTSAGECCRFAIIKQTSQKTSSFSALPKVQWFIINHLANWLIDNCYHNLGFHKGAQCASPAAVGLQQWATL